MRSHFSAQTLAEIFRDIYLGERTGALVLNHDQQEKRVHFDRGMILFAESSLDEESLGACLVEQGHISAGALAEAVDSLNGRSAAADVAQALVHRELIGKATLNRTARDIVDRIVESVFRWEGGSARFGAGAPQATVFETDVLVTAGVILKGIFCMSGFEPIHEAMQGLDNRMRIRKLSPLPVQRLALSPAHGFILSRVDGNSTLRDVISILPPGEEEVAARLLFGLLVMGVLEYDPPLSQGPFKVSDILRDHRDRQALERMQEQMVRQALAQVREQNPHEALGVTPGATAQEIENAYEQTKSQFSRDRILPGVREKFRSELTLIESRLIESFLTLTRPEVATRTALQREGLDDTKIEDLNVRVEMDRTRSQVAMDQAHTVADQYYAKARRSIREGDIHNAIQYTKLAISHNPSDARYHYLLGDCLVRNPEARWQRMAEDNFTKATQLDPWNAEYWMSLGRLYKRQGLKLRARKQFTEALKLVPNSPDVLEELKSVK